jgi:hypothetical protein
MPARTVSGSLPPSPLVAEHDAAARLVRAPGVEEGVEGDRLVDLRQREDAALLGRLDGVRLHPLEVHAADLDVLGEDRRQPRHAHLDRLADHVVEPGLFQRREQVAKIGARRLDAQLLADDEALAALA